MQTDAAAQLAANLLGDLAHALKLLGDRLRWYPPSEIDVGLSSGDLQRSGRGAPEIQLRPARRGDDPRFVDRVVAAVEGDRLPGPELADDLQELAAALVALLLGEVVAEAPLLGVITAGDDVQQQPPAAHALERRCLMSGEGGRVEAGTERDQEPEPLRHLAERGAHHPAVLAPAACGHQRRVEPELLGGAGDLPDVSDVGRALARFALDPAAGGTDGVAQAEIGTGVAVGRQEPVELDSHGISGWGRSGSRSNRH